MLGNAVGGLGLSKDRLLDFCLMIERHPDNVAAALQYVIIFRIVPDISVFGLDELI